MDKRLNNLNIVYYFFKDSFYSSAHRNRIESLVDTYKNIRIFGITYPISIGTLFSNPRRFIRFLFRDKRVIRDNIYSFTPFSFLPVKIINRNPLLVRIHKLILKFQIDNYLTYFKAAENVVTWIYSIDAFPVFSDILDKSKLLIYDCRDEFTIEQNTVLKHLKRIEDKLLMKADIVFVTSQCLYRTKEVQNKKCFYIPNGVDFAFFNQVRHPDVKINEELKNIKNPIVGYLGTTRSWLDFDLLEFLSDSLREISFVFVGPVAKDVVKRVELLKKKTNVHFLDRKSREVLPGILKGFDICLIPFKLNKFNIATNPIKFWEYMAAGKPILSLRLPEFEPYEEVVSLYIDKWEALAKLRLLLKQSNFRLKGRRMEIAKNNDLSLQAKQYREIMMRYLKEHAAKKKYN